MTTTIQASDRFTALPDERRSRRPSRRSRSADSASRWSMTSTRHAKGCSRAYLRVRR